MGHLATPAGQRHRAAGRRASGGGGGRRRGRGQGGAARLDGRQHLLKVRLGGVPHLGVLVDRIGDHQELPLAPGGQDARRRRTDREFCS
ncbi:hypothetical protein V5799_032720 [Amblyomma americanum]|uniref:Uncharacterized protein n=1 Tax=Amblyomma americanum TaxID=6943 RepID=A0AAQ4DQD1_AMBAM